MTELTDDYLLDFAREQQRNSSIYRWDETCPACGHKWHGLRCAGPTLYSPTDGPCRCPSSVKEAR